MTPAKWVRYHYPKAVREPCAGGFRVLIEPGGPTLGTSRFPSGAWKAAAAKIDLDAATCASPPADEIRPRRPRK